MTSSIKTPILFLSDTHGKQLPEDRSLPPPVDVAIHCGDLTNGSELHEFSAAIELLQRIDAPLKLVIAGNHDFTLDTPAFQEKINEAHLQEQLELVAEQYGAFEEARKLIEDCRDEGIRFLDEGHHYFTLENGARLKVYATPYTPLKDGIWGFQYDPADGRSFTIEEGTDIVISHGPPRGILDRTMENSRVGCPDLFAAVARARPRIHCFGHIHASWGAKKVAWRPQVSETPSHFTDIDNEHSEVVETLASLRSSSSGLKEPSEEELQTRTRYVSEGKRYLKPGKDTLFINASLQSEADLLTQWPWLVDLPLDHV